MEFDKDDGVNSHEHHTSLQMCGGKNSCEERLFNKALRFLNSYRHAMVFVIRGFV